MDDISDITFLSVYFTNDFISGPEAWKKLMLMQFIQNMSMSEPTCYEFSFHKSSLKREAD